MPNPYLQLLKGNSQFRFLWSAQVVSQLGDWFGSIALYTLILSLTGSAEAVGLFVSAQFLPAAFVGYWTGPLTDRFGRRSLMLWSDFGRAALCLGFLLVDRPERVPLIYVLTVLMVVFRAIFEPARKAALPDIVSTDNMVRANAVSGATWSVMLALGAALGGVVSSFFGAEVAFLLNSISFLVSAIFVSRLRFSTDAQKSGEKAPWGEAFRYLRANPRIASFAVSKTLWCLGGGITLVLTLFGREVFPMGKEAALSIGLFYAFRGLGAAAGPFIAYRFKGQGIPALAQSLVPSFFVGGIGYFLLSQSRSLYLALVFVLLAHLGGATQWVFSTSLLQLSLEPSVRGRVFALEFTGLNLATGISAYLVGRAGDSGYDPYQLAQMMGTVFLFSGCCLALMLWWTKERIEK